MSSRSRSIITNFFHTAAALLMITAVGYVALYAYNSGLFSKLFSKQEFIPSVPPPMNSEAPAKKDEKTLALTSLAQTVRILNMDRLMAISRPGMIITRYIAEYQEIMDDGIKKLDEAGRAAEQKKDLGLFASLRNDRQYLAAQKAKAEESAKKYLREIVAADLQKHPLPPDVLLIDATSLYTVPPSATDFTDEMIRRLATTTPQMPALPKLAVAPPAQPASKAAPAPKNNGSRKKGIK